MRMTATAGHGTSGEPATTLSLSGAVTVRQVDELKTALVAAFAGDGAVLLDLAGVTDADPAFFQLLASAHMTAVITGRAFGMANDPSAAFIRAAVAAGFPEPVSACCTATL